MSFVTREVKPYFERSISPVVDFLSAHRIHPNLITLTGFLLVVLGSVALFYKLFILAFLLLSVGALLDAVDGALARRMDLTSELGAFLDSTIDRFSDSAPMIALGVMYAGEGEPAGACLSFLALVGSYGVSYTKAKAEALGIYGIGGAFERAERWIVLLAGIILNLIPLALLVIALGSFFTTFQRVYEVKKNLERRIP